LPPCSAHARCFNLLTQPFRPNAPAVSPFLPHVCPAPADSEVRLHKKCRELNAEIVANAAKVQTALKLNEEDQGTIAALKKEIEKAWKMVDARWVSP